MTTAKAQTSVIGGGLAGLAAAVSLAKRGKRVRLFEHSNHLGGRAITTNAGGFRLNLGPHALYRNGHAARTFDAWGFTLQGRRPEPGPQHHLAWNGRLFPFLKGPRDLVFSPLFNAREKLDAANALRKLNRRDVDPGISLAQWLNAEVYSTKVRMLIETLTRVSTYIDEPSRLPAKVALEQIRMAIDGGVLYLDGGWQQLVQLLEEAAIRHGVEIIRNAHVRELPPGSILAVPPQQVTDLTGVPITGLHPVRMSTLDLGLSKLPEGSAQFVLGLDQPYYFSVHSSAAKLAPGAGAVVHVAKYLGSGEPASRAELEAFAELAMPGWREHVAADRFLPEMTVTHSAPWVHAPRPAVDHIPGLFLAGDWVGARGLLADASVASAIAAADLAVRHNQNKTSVAAA